VEARHAEACSRLKWAAVGVLALGAWALAWGQGMPVKRVRDFRMLDFYDKAGAGSTNRLKSLVRGAEAVPLPGKGNLWELKQMNIETYLLNGRSNLMASAPVCICEPDKRIAFSTGRIDVAAMGGQLQLEGQGFFLDVTNSHFIISNDVRAVIHHSLLERYKP